MAPDAEPTAAAADLIIDEDEYNSDSDSDFQLDDDFAAQNDDDAGLTSSDEEDNDAAAAAAAAADGQPQAKRRKTTTTTQDPAATGELDSGDEATIHKDKAKRKTEDDEEEEGGTGGFVRTRAMKMRAQDERKPLAKIDGATVDVDALWAMMNAPENNNGLHAGSSSSSSGKNDDNAPTTQNGDVEMQESSTETEQSKQQQKPSKYAEEMIKIKRTYKFAGEMITEEKIVLKDSAEAKLYLANNGDANVETVITAAVDDATATTTTTEDVAIKLRRPLRRVSRFDPNPTGAIKKSWEKQPAAEITGQDENARGPKINTVEKSRMDWAAYVDSAGLKDELKVHSKAKEGFHGRMEFLDRVGANIEEERRNARLKGL